MLVHGCRGARCKPLTQVFQTSSRSLIFTHRQLLHNFKGPKDVEGRELINSNATFIVLVATLNVPEMLSVPESTAFCMLRRTTYFRPIRPPRLNPPSTSIMILCCFTSYPWYFEFCFNSQWRGPYFVLFSSYFFSRFVTYGQLISSVRTRFNSWLIIRASAPLALTSWYSANRGMSIPECLRIVRPVHCLRFQWRVPRWH